MYNILAAYAALRTGGIEPVHFNQMLSDFHPENGRMEQFQIDGTKIMLNLAKNPAGFNQNISAVMQDQTEKDYIIVINDNAQDGIDVSWLWDVDFDRFHEDNIHSITVSGSAVRYAPADEICEYSFASGGGRGDAIRKRIADGCGNLYVLVNYTALFSTRNVLKRLEGERIMEETKKKITIGHLYPDLLNLYGDRGNIACMMQRCLWRGIGAETIEFNTGDAIDFSKLDIVLLGGGSDREQAIVCKNLLEIRKILKIM